jgi:uracil-DNA glycosylase
MTQDLFANDAAHAPDGPRLQSFAPETWPTQADWQPVLQTFWQSEAGQGLAAFVRQRLQDGAVIYPAQPLRALELTALSQVRVVIVGQDPYHGPGQAQGLAFSVAPGVDIPPSLRNIYKELQRDVGVGVKPEGSNGLRPNGSLVHWSQQGILLLNTSLTVEQGQAGSHAGKGWEVLTDALIAHVAAQTPYCVYLLWGAHAQAKAALIESQARQHGRQAHILMANHPSPLSATRGPAPFIGCGHFSAAQTWLQSKNIPLSWNF